MSVIWLCVTHGIAHTRQYHKVARPLPPIRNESPNIFSSHMGWCNSHTRFDPMAPTASDVVIIKASCIDICCIICLGRPLLCFNIRKHDDNSGGNQSPFTWAADREVSLTIQDIGVLEMGMGKRWRHSGCLGWSMLGCSSTHRTWRNNPHLRC